MDISQLAGADYLDVDVDGCVFRVGELTLGDWAPVQAWIKATVPGPLSILESADFKRLGPDEKRAVRDAAMEKARLNWPPLVGSRAWFFALDQPGGHAVALLAVLRKHLPTITLDDCQRLAERATFGQILPMFTAALGFFDPKFPAPSPPKKTNRKARRAKAAEATSRITSERSPTSSSRRTAGPPGNSSG